MLCRCCFFLCAAITGAGFCLCCSAESTTFFSGPKPRNFAHRGGRFVVPENTVHGFRRSLEIGTDILETDVYLTKDGHVVVLHDRTVDRTTNGSGNVKEMTLAELKQLDAAYRFSPDRGKTFPDRGKAITIPTVDEVFREFPNTPINIEIKDADPLIVKPLADLIRKYSREKLTVVVSSHESALKRFRELSPETYTGFTPSEASRLVFLTPEDEKTYQAPAVAIQVPMKARDIEVVTPETVALAHRLGLEVHVFTINNEETMRRLVRMGVDGIMTDRPDLLKEVIRLEAEAKQEGK